MEQVYTLPGIIVLFVGLAVLLGVDYLPDPLYFAVHVILQGPA